MSILVHLQLHVCLRQSRMSAGCSNLVEGQHSIEHSKQLTSLLVIHVI